ncbi:MAG: Crp/Fnr family transcriptional regulator [Bacteroidales bacterium]
MISFWKKIDQLISLPAASKISLEQICTKSVFSKNDFVLKQNTVCTGIYYVNKGLLRIYYYKDGREITEWFAPEDNFCFSILSFFHRTPSNLIIECLEESEIISISRDGIMDMITKDIHISNLYGKLIAGSLVFSQIRMDSILFETAHQRYEKLVINQPDIARRVPQHFIASYLGISPETLSRIRSK